MTMVPLVICDMGEIRDLATLLILLWCHCCKVSIMVAFAHCSVLHVPNSKVVLNSVIDSKYLQMNQKWEQ